MTPDSAEPGESREESLARAWEDYKAKSSTPELMSYEDFCAGFNAAMGGLTQFMRMKSRITELERRVERYEGMLADWPAPTGFNSLPTNRTVSPHSAVTSVSYSAYGPRAPLGVSQTEFQRFYDLWNTWKSSQSPDSDVAP
jgi:hypothetical protein